MLWRPSHTYKSFDIARIAAFKLYIMILKLLKTISTIHLVHALLNLSFLGQCLRINDRLVSLDESDCAD